MFLCKKMFNRCFRDDIQMSQRCFEVVQKMIESGMQIADDIAMNTDILLTDMSRCLNEDTLTVISLRCYNGGVRRLK